MATPYRTDRRRATGPSWGRRPIVLAQLPVVGSAVKLRPDPTQESRPQTVLPPAQPNVNTAQPNVNTAQPNVNTTLPNVDVPLLRVDLPSLADSRLLPANSQNQRLSQALPAAVSEPEPRPLPEPPSLEVSSPLLLQLHSLLAPHSGLIVTLALIASAGLLYWLFVEPTQTSLDYLERGPQGFGQTSASLLTEEFVVSAPAPSSTTRTSPAQSSPTQSTPSQSTGPLVPQPETRPAAGTSFPSTRHSRPLDFAKIGDVFPVQLPPLLSERQPMVAERPVSAEPTSTIKR